VPTQKYFGGGWFVELVQKLPAGQEPTCSVLVHQRRLVEKELDPYWQDCLFPFEIDGVERVEGDKITIEIKSTSWSCRRSLA